jgi:hypothetical protein
LKNIITSRPHDLQCPPDLGRGCGRLFHDDHFVGCLLLLCHAAV